MGVMMPVIENKSRYILPGKYDDLLTIKVRIPVEPSIKIIFTYEISNERNEVINKGETVLVFVDMKTNKVCRMPEIMAKLLQPFFDDQK
jgi:acyl-CoA thioester hydrolase